VSSATRATSSTRRPCAVQKWFWVPVLEMLLFGMWACPRLAGLGQIQESYAQKSF